MVVDYTIPYFLIYLGSVIRTNHLTSIVFQALSKHLVCVSVTKLDEIDAITLY